MGKLSETAAGNTKPAQSPSPSPDQQAQIIRQAIDRARRHVTAGRMAKAEGIYQQILQADPSQPVALHMLGVIAHQRGKYDVAVKFIAKSIAANPDYAEAHHNLGNALKALGKMDEAIASYGEALAIKPDYAAAHNNLGNVLRGNGKLNAAVASYNRAITIQPDYANAYNNLGVALNALGKQDEAIAIYRKALAITPDHAETHNNLGNALQVLGKMEEAAACYRKALAIAPNYAEAHRNLASAKKTLHYDNDIKAMEDVYAMPGLSDEQRMHLAFGLGKSFEDLGQYEKAFDCFLTGNAIKRGTYDYSIEYAERYFGNLKRLFTEEFFGGHQAAGSA